MAEEVVAGVRVDAEGIAAYVVEIAAFAAGLVASVSVAPVRVVAGIAAEALAV